MSKVIAAISISLDGYVAGPDPSLEEPLGKGGEQLHEWAFAAMGWREPHGLEGGERTVDSQLFEELRARVGAGIMGRRMFSGGTGGWDDDPRARGWWGEDPPFHTPVFVLTHHAREPLPMEGETTFTFVTDGIESALEQARAAAGGKDVQIHGGGTAISQCLAAGQLDELEVSIVPILLGPGGAPLFDDVPPRTLERVRVLESPSGVTHVKYRVS